MMFFSIEIGLKHENNAEPELELSLDRSVDSKCWTPLQKQEKKRDR